VDKSIPPSKHATDTSRKNNLIVRELDKTKVERNDIDLSQVQSDRERDTANEKSIFKKSGRRAAQRKETGVARKEARSYDIMAIPATRVIPNEEARRMRRQRIKMISCIQ
jgi:hypothetical protein